MPNAAVDAWPMEKLSSNDFSEYQVILVHTWPGRGDKWLALSRQAESLASVACMPTQLGKPSPTRLMCTPVVSVCRYKEHVFAPEPHLDEKGSGMVTDSKQAGAEGVSKPYRRKQQVKKLVGTTLALGTLYIYNAESGHGKVPGGHKPPPKFMPAPEDEDDQVSCRCICMTIAWLTACMSIHDGHSVALCQMEQEF